MTILTRIAEMYQDPVWTDFWRCPVVWFETIHCDTENSSSLLAQGQCLAWLAAWKPHPQQIEAKHAFPVVKWPIFQQTCFKNHHGGTFSFLSALHLVQWKDLPPLALFPNWAVGQNTELRSCSSQVKSERYVQKVYKVARPLVFWGFHSFEKGRQRKGKGRSVLQPPRNLMAAACFSSCACVGKAGLPLLFICLPFPKYKIMKFSWHFRISFSTCRHNCSRLSLQHHQMCHFLTSFLTSSNLYSLLYCGLPSFNSGSTHSTSPPLLLRRTILGHGFNVRHQEAGRSSDQSDPSRPCLQHGTQAWPPVELQRGRFPQSSRRQLVLSASFGQKVETPVSTANSSTNDYHLKPWVAKSFSDESGTPTNVNYLSNRWHPQGNLQKSHSYEQHSCSMLQLICPAPLWHPWFFLWWAQLHFWLHSCWESSWPEDRTTSSFCK